MSFFNNIYLTFLLVCFLGAALSFGARLPCDGCQECVPKSSSHESTKNCQICTLGLNRQSPCKTECECDDFSISSLQCDGAVSKDLVSSNKICRESCNNVKKGVVALEDFEAVCQIEKYRFELASDQVVLKGNCFSQWIHGHSDEALYKKTDRSKVQVGTLVEKPLNSASECQEECQKSTTCETWNWRVRNRGVTGEVFEHGCLLKTAEMVNKALSISLEGLKEPWTSVGSSDERYNWCDMGLGYKCSEGGYTCKECNGLRCVFKSDHHIAGPKFCGKPVDECEAISNVTTTATTASTHTTTTSTTLTTTTIPTSITTTTITSVTAIITTTATSTAITGL